MGRKYTIFPLFYFVFEGKFQVQAPRGVHLIRRGDLTEGFLRYDSVGLIIYLGGLIHGGAYFRDFTVTKFNVFLSRRQTLLVVSPADWDDNYGDLYSTLIFKFLLESGVLYADVSS